MKLNNIVISLIIFTSLFLSNLAAQDTTVVQTLTFKDITKRRGMFAFPDGTESYRKILMKYTLKCDSKTTGDKFDCGEWDYDTYNYIYGHDGVLDSTLKTQNLYFENGSATDSIYYNMYPSYDYWQETQYKIRHTATVLLKKDTLGKGLKSSEMVFGSKEKVGKSQFIWKTGELLSAGVSPGNITGIELNVAQLGSEMQNFEVKIGHTKLDSMDGAMFIDSLTSVFRHTMKFGGRGMQDIQFLTPFVWNGTDNLVVEFSFNSGVKGVNNLVKADSLAFDVGLAVSGSNSYLNFNGKPQWVDLGSSPTVTGAKPRTIEVWAKIDQFNNAGLFRAGTGGTGKDFSLRTTNTVDNFRAQLWGGDFNFKFPGAQGKWHHYAMVYDGVRASIYIDGNLIASKVFALKTPAVNFQVGRWQGNYLYGQMDEIRVWDKALDPITLKSWKNKSVTNKHPNYFNLIGYYDLNENSGKTIKDKSPKGNADGVLFGLPTWKIFTSDNLFLNKETTQNRPQVVFESGVYVSVKDSSIQMDSVAKNPVNLVVYGNPAFGVQIPENAPNHPTKETRNELVWKANILSETFDKATGKRIAWKFVPADSSLVQNTKVWYSPEYRLEIGRFITPYGIRLDLGANGFSWWYDVTDYVQFLRDSVDFQAGNQLELIDVQFLFIKGIPAREVVQLNQVWGINRSYSYKSLDDNTSLKAISVGLHKNSKSYRLKTRITGHGQKSSTGGGYPHCCEWKDNTHSMWVNGKKFTDWHIWQSTECANNAVFPQGGTWPGAREGWCPGDVVNENEFEITDVVSGKSVTLDYSITPVPANNPGMGSGNYRISVHLLQYGKANFANDVEIYDVITPSNSGINSRKGGLCENPKVIIRNGGTNNLKKVEFRYRVAGGDIQVYNWTGDLKFMEMVEVAIPVLDEGFFTGDGNNFFNIRACNPNNSRDENPGNDEMSVAYNIPKVYPAKVVVRLVTNNNPSDNYYQIKDMAGRVVLEKKSADLKPRTTYSDTLDAPEGCYRLYMHDKGNDGLSYWANRAQGNGLLQFMILDKKGNLSAVETFKSDFGRSIRHSFTINKKLGEFALKIPSGNNWSCSNFVGTNEYSYESNITLFPNPSNGKFAVELYNLHGDYELTVYSSMGRKVSRQKVKVDGYFYKDFNLVGQASGIYILQLKGAEGVKTRRFVLEGN